MNEYHDESGAYESARPAIVPLGSTAARDDGQQQWRGVFDVDEDRALEALRLSWSDVYDIGHECGQWVASRRDGRGVTLTGSTPDELNRQMRAGWGTP
jgi:hypothetical protein